MMKLKELAVKAGLNAPLYTATAWGHAPVPTGEFLPTWGCYAFLGNGGPSDSSTFCEGRDNLPEKCIGGYPFAFCELGGGSPMQNGWRPIVPPASVEVALFTRVACGGNLTGIYMYHGGSNPLGKHGPLNVHAGLPTISYDFQAPIGEYGRLKPAYYQIRPFQQFLREFPDLLAPAVSVLPDKYVAPDDTNDLRYMARINGDAGFLFLNNYQDKLLLPDRANVKVALKLKSETIIIPDCDSGLRLKSSVMAALPFNLNLSGVRLKYATAQLMSKVEGQGERTYVFFAPIGMQTDFVFDATTVRGIQGEPSSRSFDKIRVSVGEPGTGAVFKIAPINGPPFSIITLTRHQAEHCLKVENLWDAARLVLSEDDVIGEGKTLRVSSLGNEHLSFAIFPKPYGKITGPTGLLVGAADGLFTRYAVSLPKVAIKSEMRQVGEGKLVLKVGAAEFKRVNDILLRIDYGGDRGWAFIDGALVADNFNNGTPWELGLRRWQADLGKSGLFVRVAPWHGDTSKVLFDGMTFRPVDNAAQPALIHWAELIPEYAAIMRVD